MANCHLARSKEFMELISPILSRSTGSLPILLDPGKRFLKNRCVSPHPHIFTLKKLRGTTTFSVNWRSTYRSRYPFALSFKGYKKFTQRYKRSTAVASTCDICGKGPSFGNNVSHSQVKTRRRWNPNIQRVRTLVKGSTKRQNVCTSCLKAGKVTR